MASIKDVARLANVSISTVSLAYNQPSRVSRQTRSAIFAAAKELGFSPSGRDGAKPGQKSVMFVLSGIRETHVPTIQGVQDTCRALGLSLLPLVALGGEDGGMYAPVESAIRQRHVSGIIFAGDAIRPIRRAAEESGIPMVHMMRPYSDPNSAEILLNNRQIGADMANHLVKNGYSSIAVIGGPADHPRMLGFRDALARRGLPIYDENGWMDAASPVDDCAGAYSFLCGVISTQSNLPDAIFCQTDMIALGVLSALQNYDLRVPEDVAVAGCEDIDLSLITEPQLTSVQFPRYEQGVQAALLVSRMIAGKPSERIVLGGKLIERGSTRRR